MHTHYPPTIYIVVSGMKVASCL